MLMIQKKEEIVFVAILWETFVDLNEIVDVSKFFSCQNANIFVFLLSFESDIVHYISICEFQNHLEK